MPAREKDTVKTNKLNFLKFNKILPAYPCFRPIILLYLICFTQTVFARRLPIDTSSLDKYSYLIYGKTSSGGMVQATGFLVKVKKQLYLVTACHVVNGWYYESYEKDGSYPDTLYLRAHTKTNDSLIFIPIDIKKIKNDKSDLGCGQYSPNWPWTHLWLGQAAQAAVDLHARLLQPIHWAKFVEADHPWNEPIEKLLPAAEKMGIQVNIPRIGEPYTLGDPPKKLVWWDFE